MFFKTIFSDNQSVIYAITASGELRFYRDLARDGTSSWAHDGVGQVIGVGFNTFVHLFSGGNGIIYAVKPSGELMYYRDQNRDGTQNWQHAGVGQVIGSGWQTFKAIVHGGDGMLYAINPEGAVLFYRDQARNGSQDWANQGGGAKTIESSGWTVQPGADDRFAGYCVPLSAAAGEQIELKLSAPNGCTVQYMRLKEQTDGSVGIPMGAAIQVGATFQVTNQDADRNGCGWSTTLTLSIPADWQSGMYAARCRDPQGQEHYVVFVVKPGLTGRAHIATLANTNTWNAYNAWGGRSKYSTPQNELLSFQRPNGETSPVSSGINHLTRAELWVQNWMENAGYRFDVFSDRDFHNGIADFSSYKALILSTHPEYWTTVMLDKLQAYIQAGGRVLYLAGNGLYEEVAFHATSDALVAFHGNASEAREKSLFRNLTPRRSERAILGVAYRVDNYMTFAPYQVLIAGHRFFAGTNVTNGSEIGASGINGGAASGWEMDTSITGTAADDAIVAAGSASDDRGAPPANLQLLARGTNPGYGADMTYYDTPAGGFVFSVGSLSFGGSLVVDATLQKIIKNILDESLGSSSS